MTIGKENFLYPYRKSFLSESITSGAKKATAEHVQSACFYGKSILLRDCLQRSPR